VYKSDSFIIKLTENDKYIMIKNGEIGSVQNIMKLNSDIYFAYFSFRRIQNCFEYPIESREIDMFTVSELQSAVRICSLQDIVCKCVCLPDEHREVFTVIPLLHKF